MKSKEPIRTTLQSPPVRATRTDAHQATITKPAQLNTSSRDGTNRVNPNVNQAKKPSSDLNIDTTRTPHRSSTELTSSSVASKENENSLISETPIPMGPPPPASTHQKTPVERKHKVPTADHREEAARKKIADVLDGIQALEEEVNSFRGTKEDKAYIRLEHELTNKLLHLDTVSAAGAPGENNIRSERKAAIKRVQQTLDILELKVILN